MKEKYDIVPFLIECPNCGDISLHTVAYVKDKPDFFKCSECGKYFKTLFKFSNGEYEEDKSQKEIVSKERYLLNIKKPYI